MGLDVWLKWLDVEKKETFDIEGTENGDIPHPRYPNHTWKLTYLRASYNDLGFNRVSYKLFGVKGLNYVFRPPSDDCYFVPRWGRALKRAKRLKALFDSHPNINSVELLIYKSRKIVKYTETISTFVREKSKGFRKTYTNDIGAFFLDNPLKVLGVLVSDHPIEWIDATVHLIHEFDYRWYREACEILIDFIKFAMSLKKRETDTMKVGLAWWG